MAVTYDTVAAVENGARFYTADLHVHTFGASADVLDSALTVEAIIDAAVAAQVSIIAITDHNTDQNVAAALHYAQKYPTVLVLPGVEVSTPQGHLLVATGHPTTPKSLTHYSDRSRLSAAEERRALEHRCRWLTSSSARTILERYRSQHTSIERTRASK